MATPDFTGNNVPAEFTPYASKTVTTGTLLPVKLGVAIFYFF